MISFFFPETVPWSDEECKAFEEGKGSLYLQSVSCATVVGRRVCVCVLGHCKRYCYRLREMGSEIAMLNENESSKAFSFDNSTTLTLPIKIRVQPLKHQEQCLFQLNALSFPSPFH